MRHEEDDLQMAIVQHLMIRGDPKAIWYHPANGGQRAARQAARLKRLGVVPGIPDLAFVLPSGEPAYMELKSAGGRLRPEQKAFMEKCAALGVDHAVCADLDQALAILKGWGVLG